MQCSTLGGWVVTRGAGQCSGRYGKIEDMTLAMDGVLGNGEPFTLDAPRPGEPDLVELMVGAAR
ncbi:MAG: FAD-binding oxidoreductase, partial [Deltaproteobacteria bacterium]|nr:FAD-binding oxidoreductase [Deltaproteobacteria bacterium]